MGASGEFYGEDSDAARSTQLMSSHRTAQLSGEIHGEGLDHGYKQPVKIDNPDSHDHGPDS